MATCVDHGFSKCLNRHGYRRAWYPPTQKLELLHRVVYIQTHNLDMCDIKGMSVRHTCDNPRCVNPDHLLLGTHKENMQDRTERDRNPDVSGELNPRAVLNWEIVRKIRSEYRPNTKGMRQSLANQYGVSPATISDLILNRSWKEHG